MSAGLPDREHSRVVLLGVGTYTHSDLPDIPAVYNNLDDLRELLTVPGGAMAPANCQMVADPASGSQIGKVIESAAGNATDTLVVYYTGHGLLDRAGRLYLALSDTDPDHIAYTAVPFTTLRESLVQSAATVRVLILDCCFSGRAFDALTSELDAILGQAEVAGTYTITSSARDETSYAPQGHRNTAFTAALLAAARSEPGLSLDDIYGRARDHLRRHGYPRPQRRAIDTAGQLVLFPRHPASDPVHKSGPGRAGMDSASSITGRGVVAADQQPVLGQPLGQVIDPFALEVHRPISVQSPAAVDALPHYVHRAHDQTLTQVVTTAREGHSAMAILVGGSSSGKTRALYEALTPLRQDGGWRLWHPVTPTRRDALEEIARVRPRTILWLNETQEYLGSTAGGDERAAAALKQLLTDVSRAPILILGTLWPSHHATLTRDPGSQPRILLEDTVIEVPDAFTGVDLDAARSVARLDPRLQLALDRAEDGQLTQYLAGGPELVARYRLSPLPAAKAVIEAAIDARRMGCGAALPQRLLHHACHAYMSARDWDALTEDWFAQALAETGREGRGTRGPLTRIRPRPDPFPHAGPTLAPGDHLPERDATYQLADYLDQYGRAERADQVPPNGFWVAAALHARPQDFPHLAEAADSRGLYRHAAQLWKNAAALGDTRAVDSLMRRLNELHPGDQRPARWICERTRATRAFDIARLAATFREIGASDLAIQLTQRLVPSATLDSAYGTRLLLEELHTLDLPDVAGRLARRVTTDAVFDDLGGIERLADTLAQTGASDAAREVLRLAGSAVARSDPFGDRLLDTLPPAAAARIIRAYLDRRSNFFHRRSCSDLAWLVPLLPKRRGRSAVDRYLRNAIAIVDLGTTFMNHGVAGLLDALRKARAHEAVHLLARRIIDAIPPTVVSRSYDSDPEEYDQFLVANLLAALERTGESEALGEVAQRAARIVRLDSQWEVQAVMRALHLTTESDVLDELTQHLLDKPRELSALIHTLWLLHDRASETDLVHGAYKDLAVRAADRCQLDNGSDVAALMWVLRKIGETGPLRTLARRTATGATVDRAFGAADLIDQLADTDDPDALEQFASRAADTTPLDVALGIASLVDALTNADQTDAAYRLARRAATGAAIDSLREVERLMGTLEAFGHSSAAAEIARRCLDNAIVAPWALLSLWQAGHRDLFRDLARHATASTPVDHPVGAANLLNLLIDTGETTHLDQLIDRIAATSRGEDPAELTILVQALHRADRPDALARIANHVTDISLEDTTEIVTLISALHDANQPDALGELARRVAATVSVDSDLEMGSILDALRNTGRHNEFDVLLRRAVTEGDLREFSGYRLAKTLWEHGATHQLSRRLPAAGEFRGFLKLSEFPTQFRFGREPDGTCTPVWSWDDLT